MTPTRDHRHHRHHGSVLAALALLAAAGCTKGHARSLVLLDITAEADVPGVTRVVVNAGSVTQTFEGALHRVGDDPLHAGLYMPRDVTDTIKVTARAVDDAGSICGEGSVRVVVQPGVTVKGNIVISSQGFACGAGDGGASDGKPGDGSDGSDGKAEAGD